MISVVMVHIEILLTETEKPWHRFKQPCSCGKVFFKKKRTHMHEQENNPYTDNDNIRLYCGLVKLLVDWLAMAEGTWAYYVCEFCKFCFIRLYCSLCVSLGLESGFTALEIRFQDGGSGIGIIWDGFQTRYQDLERGVFNVEIDIKRVENIVFMSQNPQLYTERDLKHENKNWNPP